MIEELPNQVQCRCCSVEWYLEQVEIMDVKQKYVSWRCKGCEYTNEIVF